MQANVLHAIGDLRHESVSNPEPGSGEVLLRVGACGVCGSDIPRIFEKGAYSFPLIPGHEFSGTVEAVASDVDSAWVGKRVVAFPLIPCQGCPPCDIGAYAQCENYDYLGSRSDGAFAEYVRAPVSNVVEVPESVSQEEAAMTEPAAVALHALRRGNFEQGDRVLIVGAGPIGILLAQWARAGGAGQVLLADIDVEKLRFAKKLGFSHGFDATQGGVSAWAQKKTGDGADLVIEASGSAAACGEALQAARPFGTVVLLGNPAGAMVLEQHAYWAILRKELTVVGSWNSSFSPLPKNEWKQTLEALASGRLDVAPLITHRTNLDGLWNHLQMLRNRSELAIKVMAIPEQN